MATPKKRPEDKKPAGRPTEYRAEYCDLLIEHMKQGGSIESFGAKIRHAKSTIYAWFEEHPEFSNARKEGEPLLIAFYENLGKTMASGQLRRIKSEKPMIDKKGKPILDPTTGQVMMEREYEAATPAQAVFIFMTKNLLNWRDKKDIEIGGKDGGPINYSNLTDAELKAKIAELDKKSKELMKK